MSISSQSLERFYSLSEDLYNDFSSDKKVDIVIHYSGVMNQGFSNALSSRVELCVEDKVASKQSQRRFFSVFVEVIQNILIHSEPDGEGDVHAGMTVFLTEGQVCARFSNILKKENSQKLMERYDKVNSIDRVELKKMYMDRMVQGDMSEKGGAGLGVITIVLRSKNPSDVNIVSLDDEYDIFEGTFYIDT